MIVKTRFPRETRDSIFATKYMPGFQRILLWNRKCCISVHWVLLKIWSRMKGCRRLYSGVPGKLQAKTSCRVHFPGEIISECVNLANCGHPQNFQFFLLSIRKFLSDLWSTSTGRQPVTSTAWRKNIQGVTNRRSKWNSSRTARAKVWLALRTTFSLLPTPTEVIPSLSPNYVLRGQRWGGGKREKPL